MDQRDVMIDRFTNDPDVSVFLMSLKVCLCCVGGRHSPYCTLTVHHTVHLLLLPSSVQYVLFFTHHTVHSVFIVALCTHVPMFTHDTVHSSHRQEVLHST